MKMEKHRCSMCSYYSSSLDELQSHTYRLHKDDPRFSVYCKSCLRSYKKWNSYLRHLQRGCQPVTMSSSNECSTTNLEDLSTTIDYAQPESYESTNLTAECLNDDHDEEYYQAKYILCIKEKYGLTQEAVDHIVESTKLFVGDILDQFMHHCSSSLTPNQVHHLDEQKKKTSENLFKNLSTDHMQKKYFKDNFGFIVRIPQIYQYYNNNNNTSDIFKEPESVPIGTKLVWKKRKGRLRVIREKIYYQYVPLLKALEVSKNRKSKYKYYFKFTGSYTTKKYTGGNQLHSYFNG